MPKSASLYSIKIEEEVVDELDKIYYFIFKDSPARAKYFIGALKKKIFSLKEFPFRGRRIALLEDESLKSEVRFIEHKGYLIFYTIDRKDVLILHVTGPGQEWIGLF